MTVGDVAADAARSAQAAAAALDEAFNPGVSATAIKLDSTWYVVTSGTGEGYDFAYDVSDVDVAEVSAEDWDYSAWCATHSPVSDRGVAVAYYLGHGSILGEDGCSAILTDSERELLDLVRGMDVSLGPTAYSER